jgi:phosphomannomutase/phosphoglucomutase
VEKVGLVVQGELKMSFKRVLMDKAIFRAYDIRGLVDTQITADAFYTLGLAIGMELAELNRQQVFVARDGRLSSQTLSDALCVGLREMGRDVIDLGAVSTPMMYFAAHTSSCDSGLIVTGSHNPAAYNGVKMVLAGKTLVKEDIDKLYQRVQKMNHEQGGESQYLTTDESLDNPAYGSYSSHQIKDEYTSRILSDVKLHRPMKVVVDCGNGMGGPIVPEVLRAMGCEVIPLYCEVDGLFPNHHPDPTIEKNLVDLRAAVLENHADIGFGFDGDADRLGVITDLGEIIWPDRLMMYYVQDILKRYPGAPIVFDVKCSKSLKQTIETLGGVAEMCPTGHSIVKGIMKRLQAPLAGEMSGHLFFKDRWFGFDDALYSACRLLELLSKQTETVSAQFSIIPNPVCTPEIKIPVNEAEKFELMRRFSDEVEFVNGTRITIDGVRVEFEYGWGLIRASNTTPCLVARFEAKDLEALQSIQGLFKNALLQLVGDLMVPF